MSELQVSPLDMARGLRNGRPSGTRLESSGKEVTVIDGMKKLFNNRKIGSFWGKHAGLFVSTALLGGGQESTALNALSVLTHHVCDLMLRPPLDSLL